MPWLQRIQRFKRPFFLVFSSKHGWHSSKSAILGGQTQNNSNFPHLKGRIHSLPSLDWRCCQRLEIHRVIFPWKTDHFVRGFSSHVWPEGYGKMGMVSRVGISTYIPLVKAQRVTTLWYRFPGNSYEQTSHKRIKSRAQLWQLWVRNP